MLNSPKLSCGFKCWRRFILTLTHIPHRLQPEYTCILPGAWQNDVNACIILLGTPRSARGMRLKSDTYMYFTLTSIYHWYVLFVEISYQKPELSCLNESSITLRKSKALLLPSQSILCIPPPPPKILFFLFFLFLISGNFLKTSNSEFIILP